MDFQFTLTPALPRCPSNEINTSLWSKEKPSRRKLTHHFHLWFVLACSITHYGKCLCMGELSPITLILVWLPVGMSESKKFAMYKKPVHSLILCYFRLLTTVCYEHQTCTKDFSKDLKCWVVTTFGIAGLQGNSIKNHTLN